MSLKRSVEMFEVILSTAPDEKLLEPMRPKTLLFVVDDHDRTIKMTEVVRSLAMRFGSKVIIAHPPGTDLSHFLDALSPYVSATERLEEKNVSRRILEIASEYSAELIAITMPYPKVEEGVWGGSLEALIKDGTYPLLIGREPKDREHACILIYPNPLSDRPIRRAVTLAKERLDVVLMNPDDVWEAYGKQLVELLEEKFESKLVIVHSPDEVDYEFVSYGLQNVGTAIAFRNVFLIA